MVRFHVLLFIDDKMVKNILLRMDEEFFWKMKIHKDRLQRVEERLITWEDYIQYLFGFKPKL